MLYNWIQPIEPASKIKIWFSHLNIKSPEYYLSINTQIVTLYSYFLFPTFAKQNSPSKKKDKKRPLYQIPLETVKINSAYKKLRRKRSVKGKEVSVMENPCCNIPWPILYGKCELVLLSLLLCNIKRIMR